MISIECTTASGLGLLAMTMLGAVPAFNLKNTRSLPHMFFHILTFKSRVKVAHMILSSSVFEELLDSNYRGGQVLGNDHASWNEETEMLRHCYIHSIMLRLSLARQ